MTLDAPCPQPRTIATKCSRFTPKVAKRQLLPQLIRADDFPISVEKRDGGYPASIPGRCDSGRPIPSAFPTSRPFDSVPAPQPDNTLRTFPPPPHSPPLPPPSTPPPHN